MTDHGIIDNDKSEDSQCKKSSADNWYKYAIRPAIYMQIQLR